MKKFINIVSDIVSEMLGKSKISSFEKGLDTWVNEAPDEKEKKSRAKASDIMINLKKSNSRNQILSLCGFELSSLPEQLWELDKLQGLDLSYNKLENLPDKIGNLINLRSLLLGNNNLKTIPYSLLNPSKFKRFIALEKNSIPEIEVNNLNSKTELKYVEEDSGMPIILDMSSQKGCTSLRTDDIELHLPETGGTELTPNKVPKTPNSIIKPVECNKFAAPDQKETNLIR